jgi:hypothetical protein
LCGHIKAGNCLRTSAWCRSGVTKRISRGSFFRVFCFQKFAGRSARATYAARFTLAVSKSPWPAP